MFVQSIKKFLITLREGKLAGLPVDEPFG